MLRKLQMIAVGLAAALTVAGCGATHKRADSNDPGLVHVDHVGPDEIRAAVLDMSKKIQEKNARGWDAHIPMSSDTPPKPQVQIGKIRNDTRLHVNTMDLANDLMNMMIEQNCVYVVGFKGEGSDTEAVMDERAYAASGIVDEGQAGQAPELGGEDMTGLVLVGEISDNVVEVDGVKEHNYKFALRLVDTRKRRVVLMANTNLRKTRE